MCVQILWAGKDHLYMLRISIIYLFILENATYFVKKINIYKSQSYK